MMIKPIRQEYLLLLSNRLTLESGIGIAWIIHYIRAFTSSHWLLTASGWTRLAWMAWSYWLLVSEILWSFVNLLVVWVIGLNFDLVLEWGVNVLVLSDFSEDEFIWIVLHVEFIRLDNRFYHDSSLVHWVVFLESF